MRTRSRCFLEGGTAAMMLAYPWLQPHHATPAGELLVNFQGFAIKAGRRRIIVDTCIGANRQREYDFFSNLQSRFLEDLQAIGITPSDVDTVLVHASALRSRRLEYPPGRGQMGANLPPGALPIRTAGMATLEASARHGWLSPHGPSARLDRPDPCRRAGAFHRSGFPTHRGSLSDHDAGPHARPRQRPHRVARPTGRDYRRSDAQPYPDRAPPTRRTSIWTRH